MALLPFPRQFVFTINAIRMPRLENHGVADGMKWNSTSGTRDEAPIYYL